MQDQYYKYFFEQYDEFNVYVWTARFQSPISQDLDPGVEGLDRFPAQRTSQFGLGTVGPQSYGGQHPTTLHYDDDFFHCRPCTYGI